MKNVGYEELKIGEEEILQLVKETLDELDIPYENKPGKFVLGEDMFENRDEEGSLRINTTVKETDFEQAYSFVSIGSVSAYLWNSHAPDLDYTCTTNQAA